jgi:NADPH:quinone reductase-like Zn-dependent oxidoreductase
VSKHRVGDRVMVCSSGSFTTSMDVSEHLCVTAPDALTFEQAASMPVVYSTVIYSLLDAARLAEGMVSVQMWPDGVRMICGPLTM